MGGQGCYLYYPNVGFFERKHYLYLFVCPEKLGCFNQKKCRLLSHRKPAVKSWKPTKPCEFIKNGPIRSKHVYRFIATQNRWRASGWSWLCLCCIILIHMYPLVPMFDVSILWNSNCSWHKPPFFRDWSCVLLWVAPFGCVSFKVRVVIIIFPIFPWPSIGVSPTFRQTAVSGLCPIHLPPFWYVSHSHIKLLIDIPIAPYIWVNYNISLTWNKAILGWFLLLTMIPMRSQWGRYNLPRYMIIPWESHSYCLSHHICCQNRVYGLSLLSMPWESKHNGYINPQWVNDTMNTPMKSSRSMVSYHHFQCLSHNCKHPVISPKFTIISMDWFKGKSTGNHGFYHQI